MLTAWKLRKLDAMEVRKPPGVFKGVNFLTPTSLAYYRGLFAGHVAYVELSCGEVGFPGAPPHTLWGVTVRTALGRRISDTYPDEDEPSRCLDTYAEAVDYILETIG